jgi:hypothetical protein
MKRSPKSKPALTPDSYQTLLSDVKQRVSQARLRASLSINRELIVLYWQIGREVLIRQQNEGWGLRSSTGWQPT